MKYQLIIIWISFISRFFMLQSLYIDDVKQQDLSNYQAYIPVDQFEHYASLLSHYEHNLIAWDLVEQALRNDNHMLHASLTDPETWKNLELFSSFQHDIRCTMSHKVDRTSTTAGSLFLKLQIAYPSSDIVFLKALQNKVKYICKNQELYEKLDALYQQFKAYEQSFLLLWHDGQLDNHVSHQYSAHIGKIENMLLAMSAAGYAWLYSIYYGAEHNYMHALFLMLAGFYSSEQAKNLYHDVMQSVQRLHALHQQLCDIKKCLQIMYQVCQIIQDHEQVVSLFYQADWHAYHGDQHDKKVYQILDSFLFDDAVVQPQDWYTIVSVYDELLRYKDVLRTMYVSFAQFDMYMSIARLYKEYKHQAVQYSFVGYDDTSDHPLVRACNLWNPLVDADQVVPCTVCLGDDNVRRTYIITGPDGSGKATCMKAIASALILGQSLGIAPADSLLISPFDYIATYAHSNDCYNKPRVGDQVARISNMFENVATLDKSSYGFVMYDELFNDTDMMVGQRCAYSICKYMSKKQNIISLFSTYFDDVALMTDPDTCGYYKFTACIDEKGNIIYPFKLQQGISDQNFLLYMLEKEHVDPLFMQMFMHNLLEYVAPCMQQATFDEV